MNKQYMHHITQKKIVSTRETQKYILVKGYYFCLKHSIYKLKHLPFTIEWLNQFEYDCGESNDFAEQSRIDMQMTQGATP